MNKRLYSVPIYASVEVEAKDSEDAWNKVNKEISNKLWKMLEHLRSEISVSDIFLEIEEPEDITPLEYEE